MEALVRRYARTHGPFTTSEVARRFRVPAGQIEPVLRLLEGNDQVVHGDFRPGGSEREWCDVEVLRRVKRRTLAKLRHEVAPVERSVLARFLPAWHGVGEAAIGRGRLEEALAQLEGLPLSYAELERVILPSRVRGFLPRQLDELGAMGFLVWVGAGALGSDDGKIALYRRDRVARLLEPAPPPEHPSELHESIVDHLRERGACFFGELLSAHASATRTEALEALWDLVWAGQVTNDTFQALRALRARRRAKAGRRQKGADALMAAGGRWSLVSSLLTDAPEPTERAHARAVSLLERHGLVSREMAILEALPGGFSAVYGVLKAMEEAGKIRRGYFVEGLGGMQFAFPGAVDRLRSMRRPPDRPEVVLLSAVDPASPWGWLMPWPDAEVGAHSPRRVAGASVVMVDGQLVLYLDRRGTRLRTFVGADERDELLLALGALSEVAERSRGKLLRIEDIDGEPARTSGHLPLFREARFTADHRGLILEVG
jgi:ATP-dependent Lhr-like helicase